MPVINRTQFKGVKLYYLSFKEPDKYGKYTVTIGGLSDEDKKFFVGTKKVVKEDSKFGGSYVRFAVKPERLESLVFVDAKNRPLSLNTVVGNGSIANVAVANFQNSMGTFPLLNGIQIIDLKEYGSRDDMFEPVEEDLNDSPFSDTEDIDD